jgi:hypothetical protein
MPNEIAIDSHDDQRHFSPEEQSTAMDHAVGLLACNKLVVMHNKTVFALVANANSPTMIEDVQNLKLDGERSALGWTVPFGRVMPLVDADAYTGPRLRRLVSDHQGYELTQRAGALCFVRMKIQKWAIGHSDIPQGLICQDEGTVQPYSPAGQDFTSQFIGRAIAYGVEPAMTSANFHGKPEIVESDKAEQFASTANPPLFVLPDDVPAGGPNAVLGSYPIITAHPDHLAISREGCIASDLLADCFDGYEMDIAPAGLRSANFSQQLRREDLPEEYRGLKGARMRLGILATLGWNSRAKDTLNTVLGLPL